MSTPLINNISPVNGIFTGGTFVTINGNNFDNTATVLFGTTPAINVSYVSPAQIIATSPAIDSPQIVNITVTTNNGSYTLNNAFTYGIGSLIKYPPTSGASQMKWAASIVNPTPGYYRLANVTVDQYGRTTAATNASPATTTLDAIITWGNATGDSVLNTTVTIPSANTLANVNQINAATSSNLILTTGSANNVNIHNNLLVNNNSVIIGSGASSSYGNVFIFSDGTTYSSQTSNTFNALATNGIYFNTTPSKGVVLANGSTSWGITSDKNKKENIVELNYKNILDKIDKLPIYQYNYIGADVGYICHGPTAQEWNNLFPSKKDPLMIDSGDMQGVSLAAIKALYNIINEQSSKINELEKKLINQTKLIDNLYNLIKDNIH